MALADIPKSDHSRRLDSWKEIAEYLRRDIRTATRWESQGLPLHRVAGGKGRSVFAFTHEIDAWLAGRSDDTNAADTAPPTGNPPAEPVNAATLVPPKRRVRYWVISTAAAAAVAALGVTALLGNGTTQIDVATARVSRTRLAISITDKTGASQAIHYFDPALVPAPPARTYDLIADIDGDKNPEVLAGIFYYDVQRDRSIRSGELLNLTTSGAINWRFAFDDSLTFARATYAGPWGLVDWQIEPGATPARIAVSAHDYTWWASMVSVLDHTGRRRGTFVNPGWIETVLWLDKGRLAISGFNNVRDEGTLALLDPGQLDGQAPGSDGTEFACAACPTAKTLFYATFARSELNRATAGRFNRAVVSVAGSRLLITTVETGRDRSEATAMYEFDRDFRFIRARFSERYWDEHRRLEMEGRLTHSRENCPERDGPPAIHVWDAARGWTKTSPANSR